MNYPSATISNTSQRQIMQGCMPCETPSSRIVELKILGEQLSETNIKRHSQGKSYITPIIEIVAYYVSTVNQNIHFTGEARLYFLGTKIAFYSKQAMKYIVTSQQSHKKQPNTKSKLAKKQNNRVLGTILLGMYQKNYTNW